jgi:hypothetical protein
MNRENHTDLLHQHIALTYLLQPTTTIPPVPSLDQGRIATKRELRKKTPVATVATVATDLNATNGRGMKPKLQGGCSMATFSVVPHLLS